jgi:membrane-associated phospholipid phosphatase
MQALLIKLIADGALLLILAVAAPIVLWAIRKKFWDYAPILVMAGLTSLLAGKLMSLLYQPAVARPFLELGVQPGAAYIDNPGFPSDHALLATVAVVAVYMVTRNRKITLVLGTLVLLMCLGRVTALVHTPLDVIGGVIAGLAGLPWYRKLTKR